VGYQKLDSPYCNRIVIILYLHYKAKDMRRTVVTPNNQDVSIHLPKDYIGEIVLIQLFLAEKIIGTIGKMFFGTTQKLYLMIAAERVLILDMYYIHKSIAAVLR